MAALAGAVGIAALALFMLPALLGIGGGSPSSPKPSASLPSAASAAPTAVPAPTAQVYIIKSKDTLSRVARKFGITLEELLAANPQITKPDRISLGQEIIIPVPVTAPSANPSANPSAKPSGSAAP